MHVTELSSIFYRPTRRPAPTLVGGRRERHMPSENRRGYHRIHFPPEARPRLLLDAPGNVHAVCEVLECSERGLRFVPPASWLLPVGASVSGLLRFARGEETRIAGSVTRIGADELALILNRQAIPLDAILAEQRWLQASFGLTE
jgi:hypothetical protein